MFVYSTHMLCAALGTCVVLAHTANTIELRTSPTPAPIWPLITWLAFGDFWSSAENLILIRAYQTRWPI